jgi:hypothetical protein
LGVGGGSVTKIPFLWKVALAGGFAALTGCSNAQLAQTTPPDSAHNPPKVVAAKPSLVGILWKMATTEKEALPEQILPYFGITAVPPVKMYGEDYGWFSIPYQPPRVVDMPLQNLGVRSLEYHYNLFRSPPRERDRYGIRPIDDALCITADEVVAIFGQTFKRLPARISTAAAAIPNFQVNTALPATSLEKGSLHFESGLFEDRGSVTFEFDSKPCARGIYINYTRKNK